MKKIKTIAKKLFGAKRMKTLAMMLLCGTIATYAQNAAGDYTAGTDALATVTEEIAKYVPFVVKLCYAIAGVVAVVGAISVYIAMNNEEQDVKNILVLQNCQERKRKQMKVNTLWFNALQKYFAFRIFAELDIKKI
ncbi:MAG: DUF4134 family protein [Bacteroides uniformis]